MDFSDSNQSQMDSSPEKLDVEETRDESVCRLCASHAKCDDMLFEENSSVRHLAKQYLPLEFIDGLPTHICMSCCTMLKAWDIFIQVFNESQQKFKQQMDLISPTSTLSVSPSALTVSPVKIPSSPLKPRKRKVDLMLETSSLLSPSTSSSSSVVVSPESHEGPAHFALHGSETDEASECPIEVVQERTIHNLRPRRNQTSKFNKKQVRPNTFHQPAAYFPHPPPYSAHVPVQQAYCGYPMQHQPVGYPGASRAPAFYQPQHQVPFRGMAPRAPLLPPPPPLGFLPSSVMASEVLLDSFLANMPPYLHQSFLQNFVQNMMDMQATTSANLPPPPFGPRKGV